MVEFGEQLACLTPSTRLRVGCLMSAVTLLVITIVGKYSSPFEYWASPFPPKKFCKLQLTTPYHQQIVILYFYFLWIFLGWGGVEGTGVIANIHIVIMIKYQHNNIHTWFQLYSLIICSLFHIECENKKIKSYWISHKWKNAYQNRKRCVCEIQMPPVLANP